MEVNNNASTLDGEEDRKNYFTWGKNHVLNINMCFKLVILFIFTHIQRVKT